MAVNPLDVYGVYLDQTKDVPAKLASIDMLYGVAPSGAAPAPDLRTANVDPNSMPVGAADHRPAPPPIATDAGGVSGGDMRDQIHAMQEAEANAAIRNQLAPQAHEVTQAPAAPTTAAGIMSGATAPVAIPSATHEAHGGHGGEHGAAPAAPEASGEDSTMSGLRAFAAAAQGGGPVRLVPEHDQLKGTVTEKAAPIPDEVKQALVDDATKSSELARQQGEEEATAHTNAAIGLDIQAQQARADREAMIERRRLEAEHAKSMDTDFEKLVKDTAAKPGDFWATKDTGHKILSFIGAVMFGLAGSPEGLQKVIDADVARRAANREKTLGARKSAIDAFRARMMSPEAADAAERALAAQAVASDAARLAESAKAPEARLKGLQLAQEYQAQADRHKEEAARLEAGTERANIAHVGTQTTGGPREDFYSFAKKMKGIGYNEDQIMAAWTHQKYTGGGDVDTAVHLPNGEVGYTSKDLHKDTQLEADALGGLQGDLGRIAELTKTFGSSIAGPDKAKLQARIASATTRLSAMAAGQGGNARMAGEMLKIFEPLTGAGALDTAGSSANVRAGFEEAQAIYRGRIESLKNRMTSSPGGKGPTLGVSKQALGAEKD